MFWTESQECCKHRVVVRSALSYLGAKHAIFCLFRMLTQASQGVTYRLSFASTSIDRVSFASS